MTGLRFFLYLVDAISLRNVVRNQLRGNYDFVIFDRYSYDELANLDLNNPVARTYARLIERITPDPDVAFLLDADPEAAHARKPEYPIEFVRVNRRAYMRLNELLGIFRHRSASRNRHCQSRHSRPDPAYSRAQGSPDETLRVRLSSET